MSTPPHSVLSTNISVLTNSAPSHPAALANSKPVLSSNLRSYIFIAIAVVLSLIPFWRKALNVDDPLFVWAAKQIMIHPLDPYGFKLIWGTTEEPMWEVTKNPPLAAYVLAGIGKLAGWSETALHLAFLSPAIALVIGTYRLARRFTHLASVAAMATLVSPAIMVSATSLMCDTMMVAFFVWAIVLWIEGADRSHWPYLLLSALLIAACALTKYFGVSLLLLLPLYSVLRRQPLLKHLSFLMLPVAILIAYQLYTKVGYGQGLLGSAAVFSRAQRETTMHAPVMTNLLIGLSFTGGGMIPSLAMAPLSWRRRWIVGCLVLSLTAGLALSRGWISVGTFSLASYIRFTLAQHWLSLSIQLAVAIAGGISVLALAALSSWQERNVDSIFLAAWVLGTFVFAAFLNWTINSRSVLPMIPAVGILLARRLGQARVPDQRRFSMTIAMVLGGCGFVALWVTKADVSWAASQRRAAEIICEMAKTRKSTVWFEGHWGFQYYMQAQGAHPVDFDHSVLDADDLLVVPANNIETFPLKKDYIASQEIVEVPYNEMLTTMRLSKGSGFYSAAVGGPLPFAFGASRPERFFVFHLRAAAGPAAWNR